MVRDPDDSFDDLAIEGGTPLNTPPSWSTISFNESVPFASSNVFCNGTVTDSDGDNTTVVVNVWTGGSWMFNTTTNDVVSGTVITQHIGEGNISAGDVVNCTFQASDGSDVGVASGTVTAYNTPPAIADIRLYNFDNSTLHP